MYKKMLFILTVMLALGINLNTQAQNAAYAYNNGIGSYGTINLTTGAFASLNWHPQGSSYYPATGDNDAVNGQYVIMSSFSPPFTYYLTHINFATLTADSIAVVGPLASGQSFIKGMAHNAVNDTWYVISGNDFGSAAYLYTLNIATGALTVVGQIQNANAPVGIAIDCSGDAYIVNVVLGISGTAVLNSLNLTTAVATAIGTDLGLADASLFSQDMDFNPDNGNLYWTGYYSDGWFTEGGSFRLVDVTTGTSTEIAAYGAFETLTGLNVNGICSAASTFQLSVNVTNGWNMVSIPGLNTPDQNVNTWWTYRDGGANVFKYSGGYQSVTDAIPGTGYWMKHSGDRTYNTGDEWPAGGIQVVAHDPLSGATGWNLIGGYELSAGTAGITTIPSGLQSGPVYKYSGGYQVATTLDPGYGYWMKLTGAGQIVIPEAFAKGTEPREYFPEDWGKIIITDATGINYTLYAVRGKVDLSQYELPPAPPAGMFDIRFSSGRIAEDINSSVKTIDMNCVTYPLTIRVENMNITLQDESGKEINAKLENGDGISLNNNSIKKLVVISGEVMTPVEYSLEQNYPNPFNPSTKIKYTVPADGFVNIAVYNVLGEKVTDVVNNIQKAGSYEITFNARDLASGMYIYRMESGNFVSVKKMMILK